MQQQRPSIYRQLGGEDGISRLVDLFYDIIEQDPAAAALHMLHLDGHGVAHSRVEQTRFLMGFFGGPRLYVEFHGHSDVRAIHAHVAVTAETRDIWIRSMDKAFDQTGLPLEVKKRGMTALATAARLVHDVNPLRNRDEEIEAGTARIHLSDQGTRF
ncbi:globin [Labrys sp. La1]|uniref:globin domain-containing protein n=1 Tax=Labrys sp. La1 TaxID=3404917 RepID=UPI003EBD3895